MKRLSIFLITAFMATNGIAQYTITGSWEGNLNIGKNIRVVFNIMDTALNRLSGTMDSPDQFAMGIPCDSIIIQEDSIKISISNGKAEYLGKIVDLNSITGIMKQKGTQRPLDLTKTYKPTVLYRPQTPKPPFDYIVEDVVYHNADSSIQYGATITIPKGKGPFPAFLLITGSGQQNRDEEILGHKPFAVIADYLTKKGYIVLRVDDRGIGKTTGDFESSTSEDFKNDAMVSLNYLRSRKEVNKQKIGMMGHSEGGMIAPMIAADDKSIDFIILLAGPGVKISQLMEEQTAANFEKSGLPKSAINAFLGLYREMIKSVIKSGNEEQVRLEIEKEVKDWRAKTPADIVSETTHISDESSEKKFADALAKNLSSKWYKYFISYDPQPNLEKLSCKVLALNGEKDIQVIAKSNLGGINASLAKSKSPAHNTIEMSGLNHLFQKCQTCTVQEYAKLEETFSVAALDTIADWLNKNAK